MRLGVFCASSEGSRSEYRDATVAMAHAAVDRGYEIVYGGGGVGLMGILADAALSRGGRVTGVLPDFLKKKEVGHPGVSELISVGSMHERKQLLYQLSDAVVALPGGFGTMDELFETVTWTQLGLHRKPIGILNVLGYYDSLLQMLDHMVHEKFLRLENRGLIVTDDHPVRLLEKMDQIPPVSEDKWINFRP